MIINAICFTANGCKVVRNIIDKFEGGLVKGFYKTSNNDVTESDYEGLNLYTGSINDFAKKCFGEGIPLIVVGATGIAVRMIAPFVEDKLQDIPVLVIDELGTFVISLLSGHAGGANELCGAIASSINAFPVITTATDINDRFAVDVFAVENGLTITNKDGIKKVSRKVLSDKPLTISVKDYPPKEQVDILITDDVDEYRDKANLVLKPKKYVLGIGVRRGKSFDELYSFVLDVLGQNDIDPQDIYAIASIDKKKDEEAINILAGKLKVPFVTFEADTLMKLKGNFTSSEFVMNTVGADNVCERSAYLAANCGKLLIRKTTRDGMSLAVALVKK